MRNKLKGHIWRCCPSAEAAEQMKSAQVEIKRAKDEAEEAKEKAPQAAEGKLRQEQRKLEQDRVELNLEIARRADKEVKERMETMQVSFDKEREIINKTAQENAAAAQVLKMREKDIQIERLNSDIERLKLRSQSGSPEIQGEALESTNPWSKNFRKTALSLCPKGCGAQTLSSMCRTVGKCAAPSYGRPRMPRIGKRTGWTNSRRISSGERTAARSGFYRPAQWR